MNTNNLLIASETVVTLLKHHRRGRLSTDQTRTLILEEVLRAYRHGVSVGVGSEMENAQPKPRIPTTPVYHSR